MENLREWAIERATSREIAEVIFGYRKTEKARQRVWENPTECEMKMIEKRAFDISEDDEIYWGNQTTLCRPV